MSTPQVHALIPAAGHGTRYGGGVLKQYLPICGKAVLVHAIRAFQFHPLITSITVILAEDDQWFEAAVGSLSASVKTVTGGDTRAKSVRNGLRFIADNYSDSDWVLVHDAARPCVSPEDISALVGAVIESGMGGILAQPIVDTVKRSNADNQVDETLAREHLCMLSLS